MLTVIHVLLTQGKQNSQKIFVLLLSTYQYSPEAATFVPLPDMPADLPMQVARCKQALKEIDQGEHFV